MEKPLLEMKHFGRRMQLMVEKFTVLLNDYLPVPDVRDYLVTPAVAGNGSATLGNFVLAKDISERYAK